MAVFAFTNGKVVVNSVDLSDHGHQFELNLQADAQDVTAFNAGSNRSFVGGLKSADGSIQFFQDFAASSVDVSLNALIGTTVAITAKAVNATTSATNPEYQFNAVVTGYSPIAGAIGDALNTTLSFKATGAITRATS